MKKFIGKTKVVKFANGGQVIKIGLSEKDLNDLRAELSNGWVNIQLGGLDKSPYAEIDTWKPTQKQVTETKQDLPF